MRTVESGEGHAGRVVIVTGGSGGVGAQVSRRWLAGGASVLIVGQHEDALTRVVASLADSENVLTPHVATLAADVTTEEGARQMAEACREKFGKPADTLLHLVGGFAMGPLDAPDAPGIWEDMIRVNLMSSVYCYRAVLDGMRERGEGWIVGLGSRVAVQPGANLAAYAASKAGLNVLTESLSAEVRDQNIHVNVILASTIDTPTNRHALGEAEATKWVQPDDIADATFYLCGERSHNVFGATLELYGRV